MKISGVNFLSFEQDEEINFHVSIGSMLLREAESEARASSTSEEENQPLILKSLPIVWLVLPMVTVLFLMIPFSLRWNVVMKMVNHCSRTGFVALQAVRILAVGSLIKWKMGLFPAVFALGTASPTCYLVCLLYFS